VIRLLLTRGFDLSISGQSVTLAHSLERVLAYLALSAQPVERSKLAGILWLDATAPRAASNLRTALWRLHRAATRLVQVLESRVVLSADVQVDFSDLSELALRLIEAPESQTLARLRDLEEGSELLPDWDDEWLVADRERFRMLRLQALDRSAEALIQRGEHGRALEAAFAAVESDPLRESARRLIVQVHLTQGNLAEAIRTYEEYSAILRDDLGIDPSPEMDALLPSRPSRGNPSARDDRVTAPR
jgi:DNA-binding SARP family transcriptional activator